MDLSACEKIKPLIATWWWRWDNKPKKVGISLYDQTKKYRYFFSHLILFSLWEEK